MLKLGKQASGWLSIFVCLALVRTAYLHGGGPDGATYSAVIIAAVVPLATWSHWALAGERKRHLDELKGDVELALRSQEEHDWTPLGIIDSTIVRTFSNASEVDAPLSGGVRGLRKLFDQVEPKRIVLIAQSGSGKTLHCQRLAKDISGSPSYLHLPLVDWPQGTSLQEWAREYAVERGHHTGPDTDLCRPHSRWLSFSSC